MGKKNDILKFSGKWMDLEKNIFSVVTQTQKDKYNLGTHSQVTSRHKAKKNQPTVHNLRQPRQQRRS